MTTMMVRKCRPDNDDDGKWLSRTDGDNSDNYYDDNDGIKGDHIGDDDETTIKMMT